MIYTDAGVRCDRHIGEVFPVRCTACEALSAEYGALGTRLCPRHPAHFRPCEKGCDDGNATRPEPPTHNPN